MRRNTYQMNMLIKFFFFKQKTAYEISTRDWSSDVCSSDLTWNAGAERLKGWKAHEIIGQHFSKFYPPEEVAKGKTELELKTTAEEGRFEDEGWRIRKDGSRFWANVIMTALRDK